MATTGTTTQQTTESTENLSDRLRSALARLTNQQKILLMIAVAAIIALAVAAILSCGIGMRNLLHLYSPERIAVGGGEDDGESSGPEARPTAERPFLRSIARVALRPPLLTA